MRDLSITPKVMGESLQQLTPYIASLAGSSLVILMSNSFSGMSKTIFQIGVFSTAAIFSSSYIVTNRDLMEGVWNAFRSLPLGGKISLSVLSISSAFFGSAFYASGFNLKAIEDLQDGSDFLDTPGYIIITTAFPNFLNNYCNTASVDSKIGFDVPRNLPNDDTQFFQQMFHK